MNTIIDDFNASNFEFMNSDLYFNQNSHDFQLYDNNLTKSASFKLNDEISANYDNRSLLDPHEYNHQKNISNNLDGEKIKNQDDSSIYSNISTNCSAKQSPEYFLQDIYSHNENIINNQKKSQSNNYNLIKQEKSTYEISSILKKSIHKKYEPIYDGRNVYIYEENPIEYKKARKRLQNRESATRVRYRKKNFIEEAENEIEELKKENADLLLKNATLTAENNLLKKQISFLENMIIKKDNLDDCEHDHKSNGINMANDNNKLDHPPENANSEYMLPLHKQYDNTNYNLGLFRIVPQHTFKKHMTMLGIATLILCIGFISFDSSLSVPNHRDLSMSQFKHDINMGIKSINVKDIDLSINQIYSSNNDDIYNSLSQNLINNNQFYIIKAIIKYICIIGYCLYAVYICLIANWKYIFRYKLKEFQ